MNDGGLGPAGALAPRPPPAPTPEKRRDAELIQCGLKNAQGERSAQYQTLMELFRTVAREGNDTLGKAEFAAFAWQHLGASPADAHRWFVASDVDGSGRLNPHEFAVLCRAMPRFGYDETRDASVPALAELRARVAVATRPSTFAIDERSCVGDPSPTTPRFMSAPAGPAFVNAGFELDDALRLDADESDWRGPLACARDTDEYRTAQRVVDVAQWLAEEAKRAPDSADREWRTMGTPDDALAFLLGSADREAQARRIARLACEAKRVARAQPAVVRVPAPAKIFGDTHGQFRDLLLLFAHHGFPSHRGGDVETTAYVFNGDFVDRGAHQLEVVTFLFALKVLYPHRVFLIRGNHEFRSQSVGMGELGFAEHVRRRSSDDVYETIHDTFEWLPLAAVVGDVVGVMHGGVGDGRWRLEHLAATPRPLRELSDPGVPPCATQALWSDPSDSDADMAQGVHGNPGRGDGIALFGSMPAQNHFYWAGSRRRRGRRDVVRGRVPRRRRAICPRTTRGGGVGTRLRGAGVGRPRAGHGWPQVRT